MDQKINNRENAKDEFCSALVDDSNPDTPVAMCEEKETRCGIGPFHPAFLQHFAKIGSFTGFYGIAGLVTSSLSVYVNSQITTLERQFGFSSKQTALIMAANDVGFLICAVFIASLTRKVHIPRSLGLATITYGISGLICSLPHFLFRNDLNPYLEISMEVMSDALANQSKSLKGQAIHGQLCQLGNQSHLDECQDTDTDGTARSVVISQQAAMSSLIIIVVGMMLQGIGKSPRTPFSITYIDDNAKKVQTGFYLGIMITLSILGPATAFLMGGVFTRMYVTLEETKLTPKHPLWIGAWWLGYVTYGFVAIIVALPLLCFPRRLPKTIKKPQLEEKSRKPIHKVRPVTTSYEPNTGQSQNNSLKQGTKIFSKQSTDLWHKVKLHMKEFLQASLRLWTNPVYVLVIVSHCFLSFIVGGTIAFTPKYLEGIFDLPAYKANNILAVQTLATSCVGAFMGGYFTRRWKLNAFKSLALTVVCLAVSVVFGGLCFFFYCDQPEIHGFRGSPSTCSSECQCGENTFFPVCGSDGRTYYSPCSAGCQTWSSGGYDNCTCIEGSVATSGMCSYECDQMYFYILVYGIRSLLATLAVVPKITVTFRCSLDRDKGLAVGYGSFLTSLLGWLLGPVVFGLIIDGVCVIWDTKCGVTGRCLLYDNDTFRMRLNGFTFVGQLCSLLCLIIALIYAKCTGILDGEAKEDGDTLQVQRQGGISDNRDANARFIDKKEELQLMIPTETADKNDDRHFEDRDSAAVVVSNETERVGQSPDGDDNEGDDEKCLSISSGNGDGCYIDVDSNVVSDNEKCEPYVHSGSIGVNDAGVYNLDYSKEGSVVDASKA